MVESSFPVRCFLVKHVSRLRSTELGAKRDRRRPALNIDWPIFPMSWSDVGSGVIAFVATVIALGLLTDRDETALRVLGASGIAGLLATLVDLFFL